MAFEQVQMCSMFKVEFVQCANLYYVQVVIIPHTNFVPYVNGVCTAMSGANF